MSESLLGDIDEPSQAGGSSPDPLAEVDQIFEMRSQALDKSVERQSRADTAKTRLEDEFSRVRTEEIRPAMQAFLDRLRLNGGGGLLEEREGIPGTGVVPRVILWMSMSGEIVGSPRQDMVPYLQLDFEVSKKRVVVAAGDMRQHHGTSGRVGTWIPSEITADLVTRSLLEVLRRAAS